MKKLLFISLISLSFFSCVNEKKTTIKSEPLIMYKQSEMAVLMNQMYAENELVKQQILQGDIPKDFSKEFLKIHTAILTDPSDRTPSFEVFSKQYIYNIQKIYTVPKDSLKTQFNVAINSCVACHQTTCTGPIPRIKKLLIK